MTAKLHARVKGNGSPTVVLLHGFGGGIDDWYDIQPHLSRYGQVVAYDLPGHGGSLDHPAAGAASGMAKAISADLTDRGIGRVHLVGFSMGGAVSCLIGMREPERVASLTLLAPGGFGPDIAGSVLSRFATPPDGDALRKAMNDMAAPGYAFETKYVAALAALRRIEGQPAMLAKIADMIAKDNRQGEIPRASLATLAMPVTVVWGTADRILPYEQSADLPSGWDLVTVEGAGHMLPVEARGPVIRAIRSTVVRAEAQS